jgi:hypothetical protein
VGESEVEQWEKRVRADSISLRRRHLITAAIVGTAAPAALFARLCGGARQQGHAVAEFPGVPAPGEKLIASGRIVSADCKPVAGALVEVWHESDGSHGSTTVTTDGDGRFMFVTNVPVQRGQQYVNYRVRHAEHSMVVSRLHFAPIRGVSDTDTASLQRDYTGVWRTTFGLTLD